MFSTRSDVSTIKNIIFNYRRWRKTVGPDPSLDAFADWFLEMRYNLPGFDREQSAVQLLIARFALPFYRDELNADHSVSLLAILGAVSEAERFQIDPDLVMRKVGWRNHDLFGRELGGAGIAFLQEALGTAERKFREAAARRERAAMGLGE